MNKIINCGNCGAEITIRDEPKPSGRLLTDKEMQKVLYEVWEKYYDAEVNVNVSHTSMARAQDAKTANIFNAHTEALIEEIEECVSQVPSMPHKYNDDKMEGWLECERRVKELLLKALKATQRGEEG